MSSDPALQEKVQEQCSAVLGPCRVRADLSQPHGEALVLELADPAGRRWIAKAVRQRHHYERELAAYRNWVISLGDFAPALRSFDDSLHLLVLSRLPGEPLDQAADALTPEVFEQAGRLTRRLHDSSPSLVDTGFAERLKDRLERYASRAAGLLSRSDLDLARDRVAELARVAPPSTVPCHLDNQPRNWLLDDSGTVRMIDFGHAKRGIWIQDVSRMYFRHWPGHPELQQAFFTGYGQQPAEADWQLLRSVAAYAAMSTVVWAHEHADSAFEQEGRDMLARVRADG